MGPEQMGSEDRTASLMRRDEEDRALERTASPMHRQCSAILQPHLLLTHQPDNRGNRDEP